MYTVVINGEKYTGEGQNVRCVNGELWVDGVKQFPDKNKEDLPKNEIIYRWLREIIAVGGKTGK